MASNKQRNDSFTFGAPQRDSAELHIPEDLRIVEYPSGSAKKLGGGAYDPYESSGDLGDTARVRKPRVDLRKLSQWIKTTQQVQAQRDPDLPPETDLPRKE